MPGRGNLTTEGAYEKSLENTRRSLQPLHPPSTTSVSRINNQIPRPASRQLGTSHRTRVAPHRAKPKRKKPRLKPIRPPSKQQHENSQLRNGAATGYQRATSHSQETDLSPVPRLKVSKKGAPESGRLLRTIYDSSRRETLVAESVVRQLGLPVFPWRPGNPVEVKNNKGFWLDITHYVTVQGEVPGLSDADLGQCNFGIMPDDVHGLEGVEVAVGARVLDKLEADCGLSLETRMKIDLNFKDGLTSPMPFARDAGTLRRPGEMLLGNGHNHQPSTFLQLPTYDHSFGWSNTVSALPSGFSSNPASTPRTSLCKSVPAPAASYDCIKPLPPAIDEDTEEVWTKADRNSLVDIMSQGMQHGHHGHDGGTSTSQGCSFSQRSLTGFDAEEALGGGRKMAPGGFRQQKPQVPTLSISPAMGSFGQRRFSLAGVYGPHAASPVYSTISLSSASPAGTNLNPSWHPTNGGHLRSFSEDQATLGSQGTVSNPSQLPRENECLDLDDLSYFDQLFAPTDPSL